MNRIRIKPFKVIGIAVRTSNAHEGAAQDIGALWGKFMGERVLDRIPNKQGSDVYCVYTEYEGDHMKPYTTILGCRVKGLDDIPDGMVGKSFVGGNYSTFVAKGDLTKGAVSDAWKDIWQTELNRSYDADFEVYGEKAQNPMDGEISIFVGIRP